MKDYSFCDAPLTRTLSPGLDLSLFNHPEHLLLQGVSGWRTFQIVNEKKDTVAGVIHFNKSGDTAQSPLRSPFGSLDYDSTVPEEVLFSFLEFIEARLADAGVSRVVVKNPPSGYDRRLPVLNVLLQNRGFQIVEAELTALLNVGNFHDETSEWEMRKLRQAREAGLCFRALPLHDIESVYDFISESRRERSQSLSMKREDLVSVARKFPDAFVLAGVLEGENPAAFSIAIRVRKNVLYNFYSGHRKIFDAVSPVVMLIEGLDMTCVNMGISIIDLGTSALGGQPNFPLLGFKRRLGGVPSEKFTFQKVLK